jgi:PKD repeat protein
MPVSALVNQATTPLDIFASERYDNTPGAPDMMYSFPIAQSGDYQIRLYMGNSFSGTSQPGERIFDVEIEGVVFPDLNSIDLSGTYGHQIGTVITHILNIVDGSIDIIFLHGIAENPLINAIEILAIAHNEAPVAVVSAIPASGTLPLEVAFTGSGSTDDMAVVGYLWDFGDGTPASTETNPVHTFVRAGTYMVELTVTDAEGLTSATGVTIQVEDPINEAPVAVAGASPMSGTAPLEVAFTGSGSTDDMGVIGYLWDFGDGTPASTGANPVHTFVRAGTYMVELTVTDAEGLTSVTGVTIPVDNPINEAPVAVAGASPMSGTAPLEVVFTGSGSTDDMGVIGYLWDFGDGTPASTGANPVHTFVRAGTYMVELTVTDTEGLTGATVVTIQVGDPINEAPVAVASATPVSGTLPLEVAFTGSGSTDDMGVTGYLWAFGDGTPASTEANPVHTFVRAGTYMVELTVEDAKGLTGAAIINIIVANGEENKETIGMFVINPAKEVAQIQIIDHSQSNKKVTKISLHDLNGRLLGSYSAREVFAHGLYEIPIYTLSDGGIYIISFEMNTGDRVTAKLLVKN